MKNVILIAVMVLVLGVVTLAQADSPYPGTLNLYDRGTDNLGNHLIYDADLDMTWYDYTKSNDSWYNEMSWAENLTVTMADGRSFKDWRLPATVDGPYVFGYDGTTTAGYNITTSEMGHLYYEELGNKGYQAKDGSNPAGYGLANLGPFSNLVSWYYWSSSEYTADLGKAWHVVFDFGTGPGRQDMHNKNYVDMSALAVRSGDVAHVPEPATMLLLGIGLLGLAGIRRKIQ